MALNKVIVDQEFWDLFPDATVNIMFVNNFENDKTSLTEDDRDKMLQKAVKESAKYTGAEPFSSNPVIAQWRDAYKKFPKRKGARASVEALLKRASKGHHFAPINPLVDVYNSISMTYGVPVGIEDADHIAGDMHLGKAKGGEAFVSVGGNGENESDPAREGEIMYYDDEGAVCRSLNWRDGTRTQVNDDTKNAVIVIESVNAEQAARAKEAMSKLSELIKKYFNVETTADYTLTKDNPAVLR
ncbi:B3/B4 domain-containing protein [Limosilactobacillus reuteri]|jgi:DNA/RNA-binding domain of Phe-tRNA-synthetase-like protein|uniref:B3/B4 tRNA-binding domain-containing protein n=1 Tax=Limosilactobacillus reuteri TaxID=1598 RepID=A0A0U5KC41_LIMRT|nr:phenylalanine--tRNA ligase beta subunit-related protein [Limosilactobacillus reuteri]PEG87999.1 hypothetical protein CP364_09935 [Lactobacillus sp. UMNPBX13]PEH00109.1 hypothetical protein CP358_08555 [Lactobacillus sp. UMNPBX7]MBM6811656.1 hypothetical protein [Limosilactobacillus reuteri]MQB94493.1 hypothetical protein [Limosilactobacillus reuteri]OTA50006.1 hypothetical protein BHL90_06435 [Limosilactobacillus reuteri]